ncbi:unnamed protein product [Adineta steineri]|uniref:Carrier domain-containing protein n=1 Tax=Adineta steineri TaxID=433720 RepID=A0A814XDM4_9BILA|nr:unnamed protein product [Adineta steineri]
MSTLMETALLQKVQEQEMMLPPASSAIPAARCSQGAASFAQERIWLDEKIYHDPSISPAMHNFVLPLVIKHGSMSIERIRSAVVAVLEQHEILRTAIYFDKNRNMLVQEVQPVVNNGAYSFEITANDIQSPNEVADLLRNESVKHFAELKQGLVVRCHLVKVASDDDMKKLYPQDLVIFIFHGVAFDYSSISPFLAAFTKAYDQMELNVESADCYDEVIVSNIGRYFQNLLLHIFTENMKTIGFDPLFEKIGNLSLLPMNVETLSNVIESLRNFSDIKPASYAQHQIWHDEERRLHSDGPQLATYNMVFCYRLAADHTLSVQQLRHALDLVVDKHQSLRTALIFDTTKNTLTQRIVDQQSYKNNPFSIVESIYETDEQLDEIMHNETHNPHVFDLAQGLVFRCHIVRYKQVPTDDVISDNDIIIFNFHHASFDYPSMKIFLHDLHQAYTTSQLPNDDSTNGLSYLDYAVIEQHMPMIGASMFWHDALHDCKLDQSLSLPYDRYRPTNEYRSGFVTSISFDLDRDLCDTFLHYTSSQNISLEHLALSMYFVFLCKLTNGETDLCIGMDVDGRYIDELKSVIGMFVNTIPLRCQLDPQWFLHKLVKHVQEMLRNSRKYSYFPLQRLLDQQSRALKPVFLDTSFEFIRYSPQDLGKDVMIGDSHLSVMPISSKISEDDIMNKFDFILSIQHNFDMNQLSCTINASLDLFNRETVEKIAQRFHSMSKQLLTSIHDQTTQSIYELSFIMPDERLLMQSMNNTQVSFPSITCIHQEFACRVLKHPQKLAVELDEQSLTYCELLYYVQVLSLTLVNEYLVTPGEIVCQCVERSLSMVIGIMSIEMAGGVYCSLSPRDPQHRLHTFIQQTQSRLVLVHWLTKMKFNNDILSADIHSILANNDVMSDADFDRLSSITVTPNDISFIIFTSGSTGIPKAIQYRHENFIRFIYSFGSVTTLKNDDLVVQIVRCTYDGHLRQIVGILLIGATCVMLHPRGMTDFEYLADVLYNKQITHFSTVPALIQNFFSFLIQYKKTYAVKYFRLLCSAGEAFPSKLIDLIQESNIPNCTLWNLYGPAEATIVSTTYRIHPMANTQSIPIGRPLSNYRCMIMNEYSQQSITNQEGELFVGGVGVFAGYLGRDDLTAKALVEIDGQLFYRTGDLVRIDNNGLLHYQGRKDHQIKLRGQRIELGEIERCLLNIASISACVVIKWNDDYLAAYVESSHINEEELRQHCQSHLPPHMTPSIFIILHKLPLNQNGKVDRKSLPTQKILFHSSDTIHHQLVEPSNELEIYIHSLWCEILSQSRISTNTNFLSIGGHSLLLVQLYHSYKMTLNIDKTKINIFELSQHLTIADHARLIHQSLDDPETYQKLLSAVHNMQETSIQKHTRSISQENIILVVDEFSRYESFPVTPIQLAYLIGREGVIELGHVSTFAYREYDFSTSFDIECFERALNYLIQRHEALRLIFPSHTEQKILKTVSYYTISILNLDDVQSSQKHLLERREQLSHQIRPANQWPLFDFQITRFISDDGYKIRLHFGFDLLILDFWSINLVLHELNQLYYNLNDVLIELKLSYRDYILAEQQWNYTTINSNDRQYWINRLKSFPLGPNLPLQCLPNEIHVQRHCNAVAVLDRLQWQKLRKHITDHGLTPAGFLASIYALVLGKWSENKHFALNLPVFNRLPIHPQVNQIAGDFTTVIPLEINLDKVVTYYEFLHTVQKQLWNDLEHISYDGVSFIRELMQVHQTREILLPYVFTCGIDLEDIREKNVEHNIFFDQEPVYAISQTPQVFLDHIVMEIDGCLSINWTYVENLLRKEMLNHMHDTFVDLLVKLASFDETWQKPICVSLPSEQQERRLDFNQTQWGSNVKDKLLHSLVIKQAELTPNALAILSSQVNLTYRQLMNRVYSLAYHLQQQHEIKSNQLIAILMTKGWEQVVACLAILVLGGAYLPLDVDSPYNRLCSLIEETNVTILLTQSHCKHVFPHLSTISVDTFTTGDIYLFPFPIKQQSSTDLAYIIYTSGSTGKPKGVMISHQAVVNTILDMNSRLEISENDRIFALSHLNFDLSVYDMFGMLIAGGTIVIPDHEDYKNPQHWYDMIIKHHVTIWNSVPMLMQMFVEQLKHTNNHNQLRHILLSGDWIPLSLPESIQIAFGQQVTITSLGGATEASIWSIAYTLPKEIPQEWKSIPYGIPLRNQQYYVYDSHLHDCPEWVIGELYIGGEGLASGYWNDQAKTQSSFIIHPLTNERLYRTGDYGRFLPNGYIEFTGRKDFQVKVYGHRIELGEIEHHLQQHPDIHQAIVNIDDKSQRLVGYIMPEKRSTIKDDFHGSDISIIDSIERFSFKLARHGLLSIEDAIETFALTKPEQTKVLVDTYYVRKSYRQFTNKTVEKSDIEYLLTECYRRNSTCSAIESSLNFDSLGRFLSSLISIHLPDQVLPKYRYASAGSLYPVQVYVELCSPINNIPPGFYYHHPVNHSLSFIGKATHDDNASIRLHFVGRSAAISPLYGIKLGTRFCTLETGYIVGLLQQEGSSLGFKLSNITESILNISNDLVLQENDTYQCFSVIPMKPGHSLDNDEMKSAHPNIFVYLKSPDYMQHQWFIYDKLSNLLRVHPVISSTEQGQALPLFSEDDDTEIIFYNCQAAIFFVGKADHYLDAGTIGYLIMCTGLENDIGMCPIGSLDGFPLNINNALDEILNSSDSENHNIVLHQFLLGKISEEQKYERTVSKTKTIANYNQALQTYLSSTLPNYMIPSFFVTLQTFPLSYNDKIDRKSLPQPDTSSINAEESFIAPSDDLEKMLANIWQELLGSDRIGLRDNFFLLGGNSLLVIRLKSKIENTLGISLPMKVFYENPLLHSMVGQCKIEMKKQQQNSKEVMAMVVNTDEKHRYEPFPLTDIQQAYLIGRSGYIELGNVSGYGYQEYDSPKLNIERFEEIFNRLIQRHEALRLVFPSTTEQQICQRVPYYKIKILDLRQQPKEVVNRELKKRRTVLSHKILPADKWPLFDIQITRSNDEEFRLHIGFDILILDWFSFNIMWHEFNLMYHNDELDLPAFSLSFRDYVLTMEEYKLTAAYQNDENYWKKRLTSFPIGPTLYLQCLPHEIYEQRFVRISKTLTQQVWRKLKEYIREYQLSSAGLLATVFALVLARWSDQKHFAINMPIFNRMQIHSEINHIMGDFTSIIPLEIKFYEETNMSIMDCVRHIQVQLWDDIDHASYSGVAFINHLKRTRNTRDIVLPIVFTCGIDANDLDRNQIMYTDRSFFHDMPTYAISQTPQIWLDNQIYEDENEQLVVGWDYIEGLFPVEMVADMHDTFINILFSLTKSRETWDCSYAFALPRHQAERRSTYNKTDLSFSHANNLMQIPIIEQSERTPHALAVISSRGNLTYKELMNRAYSLAYHLQQKQGVQSNQLIAVFMEKGWEQVVACLAILISGAAYLPLDIDSPHDRLSSLLEDADVEIILIQSNYQLPFIHFTTIAVDTFTDNIYPIPFPMEQQKPTNLAYVIYTSGSTGKPKGVMISHQAVLNTILDMKSRLEITPNDRIFALSHLNFDLSVFDILGMLITGGTIVIPHHQHYKDPKHWYDMMIEHRVTIWNSVPMLMQMLTEHLKENLMESHLRHILISGDWIPLSLPKSIGKIFGEHVKITSLGGATEASIWSIAYTLPKEIPQEWKSIPYGIPLRNQHYYVYDIHLDDCPEWVTGELYIGGMGLANGYWKDQEKTQFSFIIHPLTNERLYRTGDYGRFLPNGYIEFTGRKDFQVKLHGHRLELGEIEYQLQQHPDIQQAIVNIDDKSQHLIGYIMPEKHSIYIEEYDSTEVLIVDSIERINFKLARHSIRCQNKVVKSFALTKPKLTETLINTYYMRKSYRQFTNEAIERSTIEKLLKNCHNSNNNEKISLSHLDSDILSHLLAVLTPISISDQPLPKYRYASIDDLYPVQVYVELPRSIDNISSGIYYHNPDEHTLELISTHTNNEMMNIRLHLVGRSSAIAPLYGKRLGSQFCMLETGYIMGLLEKEGSRLRLRFSKNTHNESITSDILNIDENDTHCCFKISSFEQNISNDVQNDNHQCIIYLKSADNNKDQWFIYDKENDTITPSDVKTETTHEEVPLFFEDDDDTKIIFHDCQCAVFFIGRSEYTMNIGKMSHLLMDHCLEMNIGMCPIGTHMSFPKQINDVLDTVLIREKRNGSNILHTLLIGKVSNKQKYERTITKAKSMPKWSETLRIYLKKKLPLYMVPSYFINVSSFPLSPNGKINRKALREISLSVLQQEDTYNAPNTELEKTIAIIWQEILYTDRLIIQHDDLESNKLPSIPNVSGIDRQTSFLISTTVSFFSVGGNSLLLVKIYQHYQSKFNFEAEVLSIRPFFDYTTIVEHAKLLEPIIIDGTQLKQWHTLHINEGTASYAQERIFLDEQVRFSDQIAIYNELNILKVSKGLLSVNRLLQALRYVLSKHKILRTSLVFNDEDSILKQSITNKHLTFTLAADETFKSETELHSIISQINTNPNLFDLSNGRVFYCHILRQQRTTDENYDKEMMTNSDVLVIGFHHVAIDRSACSIFLNDLCNTYNSNMTWLDDEESLQYIDYAVHERLIDMTLSCEFWRLQLEGCNLKRRLSLPIEQHRLSNDQRSGFASTVQITFDRKTSSSFLNYASLHHLTLFQLGLATFYTFLFKLTYSQTDLCISCVNANRYRPELQTMVGMFVSTLPYCIQLNPCWSFHEVVKYVREKCLSILEHSHYPLQHILRDFQLNPSTVPFLQTVFDFMTESSVNDQFTFDDVSLEPVSLKQFSGAAKFDFSLEFVYNPISDDKILSCRFICSCDLFEDTTVTKMMQRFQYFFEQLFSMNFNVNETDLVVSPITKLTLILPDEMNEIQYVAFYCQSNVANEAPASFAQARIWLDERIRFDPDKPQIAIYNMPFVYRLHLDHTLSIKQLLQALHITVNKHPSLHTSFHFDIEKNLLMQRVINHQDKNDNNNMFSIIETTYETDEQLNEIFHDERRNSHLFNLAQGLVFRCHLVYYKQISSNHLLSDNDLIIFNFHHASFDFPSMNIFLHDLNQAYTTGQLLYDDSTTLRYLDYAFIEQQMSMIGASMFWLDTLHHCKLDQSLPLPFDRYRLSNEYRTGRGTSISFDFGQDLSRHFLIHASSNNISLEHLTFTIYFIFLFKLTNGQTDLCIAMNINNNRYRDELKSTIGLFENVIPLRCQLDPHWSFHQLLEHVQEITTNSMTYSYFPLQHILNQHPHISKYAFLDISLEFISHKNNNTIMIGDSQLVPGSFSFNINEDEILSIADFSLSIYHDMNMNQLSCTINASLDLFNIETVEKISQRFHFILHQLSASITDSQINKPIYELSVILSNEQYLMQSLNNTQISFSSSRPTCIHHKFVCQVMKHPQKLAVELDEQSLTYCELLYYVQVLSLTLLNKYHVSSGEIICQCVERSLSMVIGIMGIEMAGGVYCPLSPRDPQHRLHALVQQTESRFVLVHDLTKTKFHHNIALLNIDLILFDNEREYKSNIDRLSNVLGATEDMAYIIFTSGSTGTPKAAQMRHGNFSRYMYSLVCGDVLKKKDTIIQIARCSFDVHVQEILGTLTTGATLAMLHPGGISDPKYLADVIKMKNVTCITAVPTILQLLFDFLQQLNDISTLTSLRCVCTGGEMWSDSLVNLIFSSVANPCILWNLYGPAETTIVCTVHRVNLTANTQSISIGKPLSNYQCMVMNEYLQSSVTNQEGELFVGGVGVFAGYLGRDDLTAKVLVEIDGQLFYRTGDLVRTNNNGLLYYVGRKDFQIKLRGQRIELGEIERCLLNITSISACVVMKSNDDYLVAYVESSHVNEAQLRQHCQSHLPSHMIPSIFMILDKLPLNPNGKIDRKLLPPPHFSSTRLTNSIELLLPTNDIEVTIHHICCKIFKQNQISTDTNMFTIGGHSLLMMQLFHQYKTDFDLEQKQSCFSISNLFQHPTIIHHAQLVQQSIISIRTQDDYSWSSLHLTQARASFAQERIYLDEQIRFSSNKTTMNNMYVIPLLYRISSTNDHISITRFHQAFHSVITKHNILRTALYIDDTNGAIKQHYLDINTIINDNMRSYGLTFVNIHDADRHLVDEIISEILNQADLFDLSKGRVIRCHILCHSQYSRDNVSCENDDLLSENDYILISVHHAMFDGASTSVFLRDLSLAYQSNDSLSMVDSSLNYIDYSVYEHIMDMTLSREFWHSQLNEYNIECSLSLPVDRQRSSTNQQRSGLASTAQITFDNKVCTSFLNYASSHHLTLFQLGLSIFYVFLFKLTHGQTDLCISSINANRYRSELVNMIGMFVSTLPYRVELDPHWSFDELVKHVREKCLSILEHSHYPLQHILGDNRLNQLHVSFLETMFDFISVSKDVEHLCLNDTNLEQVSLEQSTEMSKFDFSLTFNYNPFSDNKRLSCRFVCSHDLFEKSTISQVAQRFEYVFEQLFQTQSSNVPVIDMSLSINKVCLILPEEAEEMELVVFYRLESVVNEGMILWNFVYCFLFRREESYKHKLSA